MTEKRFVLELQARSNAVGSRGQSTGSFATESDGNGSASFPASIETLSGRELEIARQQHADARIRIRVFADSRFIISSKKRWYEPLTGRIFTIGFYRSIDDLGHEFECLCAEEID